MALVTNSGQGLFEDRVEPSRRRRGTGFPLPAEVAVRAHEQRTTRRGGRREEDGHTLSTEAFAHRFDKFPERGSLRRDQ